MAGQSRPCIDLEVRDAMRRMLVIIAFVSTLSVGLGIWYMLRPPVNVLIVPAATEVEVIRIGFGEQLITYQAPGAPYAWKTIIGRNLLAHGWTDPIWWRSDMPVRSYWHMSRFWFGTVWDQADIWGESGVSKITTRRWIEFPAWVYRLRRGATLTAAFTGTKDVYFESLSAWV